MKTAHHLIFIVSRSLHNQLNSQPLLPLLRLKHARMWFCLSLSHVGITWTSTTYSVLEGRDSFRVHLANLLLPQWEVF